MYKKSHKHKSGSHTPRRKKVSLFYKIGFSSALTLIIALFYFAILASSPRSIAYVTNKVKEVLREKFDQGSAVGDVKVGFTKYGTLKVIATDLKIFHHAKYSQEKEQFFIPVFESEFSLFKILFGKFSPKNIRIANSEIILQSKIDKDQNAAINNDLSLIFEVLESIKEKDFPIKNLKIENTKLLIGDRKILIREINIQNSWKGGNLQLSSLSKINLFEDKKDIDLSANCLFGEDNYLKCDLFLDNFAVENIVDLDPSLAHLKNINAALNLAASFVFNEEGFSSASFKVSAGKGSFNFPNFFNNQIDFDNFLIAGDFDNKSQKLNLSKIESDLSSQLPQKPHLAMSLLASDIQQENSQFDFNINLSDVETSEFEKLWPIAIEENNEIRTWVISHIKDGAIKNANANFSLIKNKEEINLDKIESKLAFSGLDLHYDEYFPSIHNLSGVASFNKNSMNIELSSGDVLDTKISQATVAIDNFLQHKVVLKINGKSAGAAADSLKHTDHKSDFAKNIEKYLNGTSQNTFDIRIPLIANISLKDVYIAVSSAISGMNNEYAAGNAIINVKKDFANNNFIANFNLNDLDLHAKDLDLIKKAGVIGGLDFILSITGKKLEIKNISLWKQATAKNNISKISGGLAFKLDPFSLYFAEIKNHNFGQSDYEISYSTDAKMSKRQLNIKGKYLNIKPLIDKKFSESKESFLDNRIQVAINNLEMANGKKISNFYLFLDCKSGFCYEGLLKGSYEKNKIISLKLAGVSNRAAELSGIANDIGYLAEALGISNLVSFGDAKFKMQNQLRDGKQNFKGQITVDGGVTFYENESVKKLATNDLFSKIRDSIFSNDKTTFDSLKIDLSMYEDDLEIKSLIANNYKIGITAKGMINLKKNTYEIKGMIIPGFVVNNLFGIGNIPIIGSVISGVLTGGEGGGLFGIRYEYIKKEAEQEGKFTTNAVSSFLPTTIQNLLDAI